MRKKAEILFLFTTVIISSCTSVTPTSNLNTPTNIFTSTLSPVFKYQRNCLEVETTIPSDFLSEGAILLGDYMLIEGVQPFFYITQNNRIQSIPDLPNGGIKIVSPDGKWLAYDAGIQGDSSRFLGIGTFTSQPVNLIPFEEGWKNILYWLDNSRVVLETGDTEEVVGDGEIVINIFTGERVDLDVSALGTSVHFDYYPRFDPTLSRVVYFRDLDNKIVLLDWQTGRELWILEVDNPTMNFDWAPMEALPLWSPDGTRFVLGGPMDKPDDLVHELLIVNRDGHVEQITQFKASGFQEGMILQPRWSPDQRYIAFWFANSLTVFDTLTGIATDYCIAPSDARVFAPVWSPDSRQIAFGNEAYYSVYPKRAVVLNIPENRAFEVAEYYYVLGWMTTSP